jgi:hypothetical protein
VGRVVAGPGEGLVLVPEQAAGQGESGEDTADGGDDGSGGAASGLDRELRVRIPPDDQGQAPRATRGPTPGFHRRDVQTRRSGLVALPDNRPQSREDPRGYTG